MNTDFIPFNAPPGKIRSNGDSVIEYHIYPKVQWVVKNYGAVEEKWYSQVVDPKWGVKEYPLSERYIEQFKKELEKSVVVEQQVKQFYAQINKPLANVGWVDFSKSAAFTIYQHGYGITTEKSRMPILGTWGAGLCLILALYDDKNKIAALANIDIITEVKSLENMFCNFATESTVAHLYGGEQGHFDKYLDIIEFIKNSQIKIENCALMEHSNGDASLAIDARNGRLYSPVEPSDLTAGKMFSIEYQAYTPLNKGYDGLVDLSEVTLL